MPGYKGHLIGGAVIYGFGLYLLANLHPSPATMAEWLLCTLAGSLFPDIDVKSKGQKYFYWALLAVFALLLVQGNMQLFIFISILAVVPMLVRHRRLFHKLWFVLCFPAITGWCLSAYFPHCAAIIFYDVAFFVVGAVSHLWLDVGWRRMLRV